MPRLAVALLCTLLFGVIAAPAFAAPDASPAAARRGLLAQRIGAWQERRAARRDFQTVVRSDEAVAARLRGARWQERVAVWKTLRALNLVGAVALGALHGPLVSTALFAFATVGANQGASARERRANTTTIKLVLEQGGRRAEDLAAARLERWTRAGVIDRLTPPPVRQGGDETRNPRKQGGERF
jgi:hypothetical protein